MAAEPRKRTFGMVKLKIGARVMVPIEGGKREAQIEVGDKTRHPSTKFKVRCIDCKTEHETEGDMLAAHPPAAELREREEVHRWAWYSAELSAAPSEIPKGATKDQAAEIDAQNKAIPRIGLVSDDPWIPT